MVSLSDPLNTNPIGQQSGLNTFTMVATSGVSAPVVQIATGPCQVFFGSFGTTGGVARYVKLFDIVAFTNISGAAAAQQYIVPGNATGGGSNIGPNGLPNNAGLQFRNGLAIAVTANQAIADLSGISGDTIVNIGWR